MREKPPSTGVALFSRVSRATLGFGVGERWCLGRKEASSLSEHGSSDGDESGVNLSCSISRLDDILGSQEGDLGAGCDVLWVFRGGHEHRESLECRSVADQFPNPQVENTLTGNFALLSGQDTMNGAASV